MYEGLTTESYTLIYVHTYNDLKKVYLDVADCDVVLTSKEARRLRTMLTRAIRKVENDTQDS